MARNTLYPPSVKPGIPKLGTKPEGWIKTTFGEVLRMVQRPANIKNDVEYQLVTAKRGRGGIVPREVLTGKKILTKIQYYVEKDDFLISKRQIVHGACGVVPESLNGALVSGEYSVLRVKDGLLLKYLDYFSHTDYFQMACFQASVGVDVEKMIFDLKGWLKFEIYLPPLCEQQKILSILNTWDEAIAKTERLIAALRERKKGLMQRLLTGQFRFAGFAGEWKEYKLGTVAKLSAGGTPSTQIKEYWGGEVRWMNSGDIHQKRVYEVENRITQLGLNNSSAKLLPANSVLIALAGQGKTRGTVAISKVELSTNQSVAAIIPQEDILYPEYLFNNLDSRYEELRRLSTGDGGRGGLNLGLLGSLHVKAPTIAEQKHIASVLELCDREIDLHSKKLEALRQQKKGLMQRLLTGQVRVRV